VVDISVIFEIIIIRGFVFSRVSHGNMKVLIKGMVIVMEKILIVDDSLLQATRLKDILDDEYDITIAQTAEDGLRRASAEKYSLILLDVVMPGMDGFTLLKKLQEEIITQSIPVILITSLSDVQNEYQGLILGAVDYIVKPFNPLIVKARVNTHIKLYNYRKQVEHQSNTDQLTGIANRRQYENYSSVRWSEAVRLETPFSICMLDIDHFKAYNDTFGHPAGDKVIAAIAGTVSDALQRSTDFVARYGGEEFVVCLLGDSSGKAFEYMKKIRKSIEGLCIPHEPSVSEWVSVSIGGVTVIPKAKYSYDFYLKTADTMLYDAKKNGRNQVVWADEKMRQLWEK
jgi:diguanylate cyclase (GGDEF)-like protein